MNKLTINLEYNYLRGNIKFLAEAMKYLPKNMQQLSLYLWQNKLGENPMYIKWIGEGIE